MTERSTMPPLEIRVAEALRRRNIRGAFFDLDDTLIVTGKTFGHYIAVYSQALAELFSATSTADALKGNPEYIYSFFIDTLKGLQKVFHVNQALLHESARITALHLGLEYYSPEVQTLVAHLMQVYEGHMASPSQGAHQTLRILRQAGVDPILVTHAAPVSTRKKLRVAGLGVAEFAHIFCIDDLGVKGPDEWGYSLQQAGIAPQNAMVIGDNWKADIFPALEIGVPVDQVVRVHADTHLTSPPISGIAQLEHVGQLPEHIAKAL